MTHYDFNGKKINSQQWMDLFGDIKKRTIGYTELGRYRVSTVWLGLNYNYDTNGAPHIFETMIFDEKDDDIDIGCYRYASQEEARLGHQLAVQWVKRRRFKFWEKGYWSG